MPKCKSPDCPIAEDQVLEESGYCFTCAEELACLLHDEGLDPTVAYRPAARKF